MQLPAAIRYRSTARAMLLRGAVFFFFFAGVRRDFGFRVSVSRFRSRFQRTCVVPLEEEGHARAVRHAIRPVWRPHSRHAARQCALYGNPSHTCGPRAVQPGHARR
eukprot:2312897-Rhodomonas_salina.1